MDFIGGGLGGESRRRRRWLDLIEEMKQEEKLVGLHLPAWLGVEHLSFSNNTV